MREQAVWNLTGILSGFARTCLRNAGDRKMAARFRESVRQGVCSICLDDGGRKLIAEFSASNDVFSMVKAEFIAMRLAQIAGRNVAPVALLRAMEKDALIVERLDRMAQQGGMVSRRATSVERPEPAVKSLSSRAVPASHEMEHAAGRNQKGAEEGPWPRHAAPNQPSGAYRPDKARIAERREIRGCG